VETTTARKSNHAVVQASTRARFKFRSQRTTLLPDSAIEFCFR
jgi:hypothetical protein